MGTRRVDGTPLKGLLRCVRVAVVTVTVVVLAAVAHLLGGEPVAPSTLVSGMALVLPPVAMVSGHRLSVRSLFLLLLGGQFVLHHVFSSAHLHHGGGMSLPSAEMLGAHLALTVVTALVLARGEHAVWAVWSWLRHRFVVSERRPLPSVSVRRVRPSRRCGEPQAALLLTTVSLRGPPWLISSPCAAGSR